MSLVLALIPRNKTNKQRPHQPERCSPLTASPHVYNLKSLVQAWWKNISMSRCVVRQIEFFLWGPFSEAADDQQLQVFCFLPQLVFVSSGHWALFPNEQAEAGGQLDRIAPIHHSDMQRRNVPPASQNCAYLSNAGSEILDNKITPLMTQNGKWPFDPVNFSLCSPHSTWIHLFHIKTPNNKGLFQGPQLCNKQELKWNSYTTYSIFFFFCKWFSKS